MILLRMISVVVGLFTLLLFAWVLGLVVPPIYEQVAGRTAVQALGYDSGLTLAKEIGLIMVPTGLGLSLIIWYHVAGLTEDVRYYR